MTQIIICVTRNKINFNMLCNTKLHESRRYTFYYSDVAKEILKNDFFRSNFINILDNTLRVDNYTDSCGVSCDNPNCVYTMPKEWIARVGTIEDIVKQEGHTTVLPEDVMLIINDYIP